MTAADWIKEVDDIPCIPATTIVPREWDNWFWEVISDNAPFSWGDNNHSLVTARRFADHFKASLAGNDGALDIVDDDIRKEVATWLEQVYELDYRLIDLEN